MVRFRNSTLTGVVNALGESLTDDLVGGLEGLLRSVHHGLLEATLGREETGLTGDLCAEHDCGCIGLIRSDVD